MKVNVVNLSKFNVPSYAKDGDAGMDLRADLSGLKELNRVGVVGIKVGESIEMHPGSRVIIPTNLFIELPKGMEAQVRPRSGASFKKGFSIANSPGTIDSGFRGNIGVIIANNTPHNIIIEHGERIAQLVFAKYEEVELSEVEELGVSERGEGGFGSTGEK